MPSLLMPDEAELAEVTDDVFSYMCSLAMEKCSKKSEKKKASCGGEAMRRRLLIKNFVAQMIAHEKQSRVDGSPPLALREEDSGMEMDLDDGRLSMVVSERPHERANNCVFDNEGEEEREEDGEDEDSSSDEGEEEEEESEVDDEQTEEGEKEEGGNGDDTTAVSDRRLQSPSLAHYPPFGVGSFYPPPFTAQRSTTTISQDYSGCFSSTETSWANLQAHLHPQGCYNNASCSRYDGSSHFNSDSPSSHTSFFYPIIPSSTAGTAITPAPTDDAAAGSTVVVVAEEVREELRLGEMSLLEDEKLTCTSQLTTQAGGNYTTHTTSVRAFTSLSNVAFSATAKLGSCRSEFMPSAYHNLHNQSKSITDLDTHITVLEEEDVEETGNKCLDTCTDTSGSPRKRHLPLLVVGDGVSGGALYSTSSYCVSKLAKRFKL